MILVSSTFAVASPDIKVDEIANADAKLKFVLYSCISPKV